MKRSGLCESCGLGPAELVVCVSSAGGRSSERRLCGRCARDAERVMFGDVSVLTSELLGAALCRESDPQVDGSRTKVCPECGNTGTEVEKTGMMGCSTCYEVFRNEIEPTRA